MPDHEGEDEQSIEDAGQEKNEQQNNSQGLFMSKEAKTNGLDPAPQKSAGRKGSTSEYPMLDLREVCDFAQTIRSKGVEAETMPTVAKATGYASPTSTGFYRRIVAARLFQLLQAPGAALTPLALDYFKPELGEAKSRALKQAVRSVASYQPLLEKYQGKKLVVDNIENAIARSSDLTDECALLCAKCFVQSLRFAGELDGDDVLLASAKATAPAELEQPQITRSAIPPQLQTTSDLETYYLTLDAASKRRVIVQAPAAVTAAELKRIQDWLSFQLLITEMGATEP
jgi:hypothetical protein